MYLSQSHPEPPKVRSSSPSTSFTEPSRRTALLNLPQSKYSPQPSKPFSIIQYWLDLGRLLNKHAALLRAQSER